MPRSSRSSWPARCMARCRSSSYSACSGATSSVASWPAPSRAERARRDRHQPELHNPLVPDQPIAASAQDYATSSARVRATLQRFSQSRTAAAFRLSRPTKGDHGDRGRRPRRTRRRQGRPRDPFSAVTITALLYCFCCLYGQWRQACGRSRPPAYFLGVRDDDVVSRVRAAAYDERGLDERAQRHAVGIAPDRLDEQVDRRGADRGDVLADGRERWVVPLAIGRSSKPITAMSSGTRRPASAIACRAPAAIRSLQANTESGRWASSRRIAS